MRVNRICCNRCDWLGKFDGVKWCAYYYVAIPTLFAHKDETECSAYEPRIKSRL